MRGVALIVAVGLASGCGRQHRLQDGEYRLSAREVEQDDCGLAPAALTTGRLTTAGDVVELAYDFHQLLLVGSYLSGREAWRCDGTAMQVSAPVRGQACQLDAVTMRLEATPTGPTTFGGRMTVTYDVRHPEACACTLSLSYDAVKTGP